MRFASPVSALWQTGLRKQLEREYLDVDFRCKLEVRTTWQTSRLGNFVGRYVGFGPVTFSTSDAGGAYANCIRPNALTLNIYSFIIANKCQN